jgi:hypothetical protein
MQKPILGAAFLLLMLALLLQLSGCTQQNPAPAPPVQETPPTYQELQAKANESHAWKVIYGATSSARPNETSYYTVYEQLYGGSRFMRIDVSDDSMLAQGVEFRAYDLGNGIYFCMKQLGNWTCAGTQTGFTEIISELLAKIGPISERYTPVPDGALQVAGANATCFKQENLEELYYLLYSNPNSRITDMQSRTCYSRDAIPLYYKISMAEDDEPVYRELLATSYSYQVTDSDFELPASPIEIKKK